jgi:hypothetical protein
MAGEARDAGLLAEPDDPVRLDHDAVSAYTLATRHLPRAAAGTHRRLRDDHDRDGVVEAARRGVTRAIEAARPHR